jgi:hypothetical protein
MRAKSTLIILVLMILTNFGVHSVQNTNKLKNSQSLNNRAKISYLQQSGDNTEVATEPELSTEDDNAGNALDGQVVLITDPTASTDSQTVSTAPAQTLAESNDDGYDDRISQALDVTDEQGSTSATSSTSSDAAPTTTTVSTSGEAVPEDTAAGTTDAEVQAAAEAANDAATEAANEAASAATITAAEASSNDYNYHIDRWDSSVKHEVYPDEDDSMVNWGVMMVFTFLVLIFIVKMAINACRSSSYFSMRPYKMKAVYAILRDLAIFVFILSILLALHFHSYLDFIHTNIENVFYGIYLFTITWIISSLVLLYT